MLVIKEDSGHSVSPQCEIKMATTSLIGQATHSLVIFSTVELCSVH